MTGSILVPLDGSQLAETAIPFAVWLAKALTADLVLLSVVGGHPNDPAQLAQAPLASVARSYMERTAASLLAAGPAVRTEVREGKVTDAITTLAAEDEIGLVVLTTLAGGGDLHHLGGVAERLSRTLTKPALFVSPASHVTATVTGPLIVALDGSQAAEVALEPAQNLAAPLDLPITLVRVAPWANELFAAFTGVAPPSADEEIELGSNTYLAALVDRLPKSMNANYQTLRGHPAQMLVDYAREQNGLLVLSSHGESGQHLWHLGSTTDKVLRASRSPVLVVPVRETP